MFLDNQKRRFGFGCMRLPMKGEEVDIEQFQKMVDAFIEAGFTYFDTAHGYIDGKSETAIKTALTSRYPRDAYSLTNKLTEPYFQREEDIVPFFRSQLEACGVDYFDFYLMHAQNARNFEHFKRCRAYETAFELKRQGLVKHVGLSFHDTAEVLDNILSTYPEVDVVQIQFNYLDYESPTMQSKACYEVCAKHGKPIIVMEPVKGGTLVNLPQRAKQVLDDLKGGSYASYALRFVLSFPQIAMVLSGMSTMEQMEDNISFTADHVPLNEQELEAIANVRAIFTEAKTIPCTHCSYCVEQNHCPKGILIPDMFAAYNSKKMFRDWTARAIYHNHLIQDGHGKASDCIRCGACERACPQKLSIRLLLQEVANEFES